MMTEHLQERIAAFKSYKDAEPTNREDFIFWCGIVFQLACAMEKKGYQKALEKALNVTGLYYQGLQWSIELYEVGVPWTDDSLLYEFANQLRVFGGLPEKRY